MNAKSVNFMPRKMVNIPPAEGKQKINCKMNTFSPVRSEKEGVLQRTGNTRDGAKHQTSAKEKKGAKVQKSRVLSGPGERKRRP